MVGFCVGIDLFGDLFKGFELGGGLAIAEGVVGDDGEAKF